MGEAPRQHHVGYWGTLRPDGTWVHDGGRDGGLRRSVAGLCGTASFAWGAAWTLILSLTGCVTYDLPTTADANLHVPGNGTVSVTDLSCRPDGSAVATGVHVSGLSVTGGLILWSADRGLHWEVVRPDESMSDVTPWFLEDPRDKNQSPQTLYVTGYRNAAIATAVYVFSGHPLGPWLISRDNGRTWARTTPLAPFGLSRSGERDARRLLQVDSAGTLAFTRVEGGLNPLKDSFVVLVRSRDGGRSWTESVVPGITSYPHALLSDGRGGVVIVSSSGGPSEADLVVMQSEDSGERWTETLRRKRDGWSWGVAGQLDGEVFIWNQREQSGRVYFVSRDGGRTWSGRTVPLWQPFRHIASAGPRRWVALSVERTGNEQEAVAWVSIDGGETWSAHRTGIKRRRDYEAMGYRSTLLSLGNGVFVAHAGGSHVARSSDNGDTWQLHNAALPDRDFGLAANCADGDGLVILAGDYGLLTRSVDFGVTWQAGQILGQPR